MMLSLCSSVACFFLTRLGGLLFRNEVWGSASGGGGGVRIISDTLVYIIVQSIYILSFDE